MNESAALAEGEPEQPASPAVGKRGGRLVTSVRAEPKTFNPVTVVDLVSRTIIDRMIGGLIHIDRSSGESEPAAAESWEVSADGRRYTLALRRGLQFSDGHPFDADDVLFSFEVYLDEKIGSEQRNNLIVGDRPLEVRKLDSHTVEIELAQPTAEGVRIFDGIAMLPEHLLGETLRGDQQGQVWGLSTPPESVVGLGPFKLKEYVPGERCVLERNDFYWEIDDAGIRLPYLDELVFVFVPDGDAQVIRFLAGETDLVDRLNTDSFATLEREREQRGLELHDLGPSLDYSFLVFNLNDPPPGPSAEVAAEQAWFRSLSFRQAVSRAIDREAIARIAYRGKATPLGTIVSPGNKRWFNKSVVPPRRSVESSRGLLAEAGFGWDARQRLMDARGNEVGFSIVASSSNNQRMAMATLIQQDLEELGIEVRVVPLEHRTVVEKLIRTFDYEACVMSLSGGSDADPNRFLNVMLSGGNLHIWHMGQNEPATAWEAEIDQLMRLQQTLLDYDHRKMIFGQVQAIMGDRLPLIPLVSPHLLVGSKDGLGNLKPTIEGHPTLWNVDELFWQIRDPRL